MSVPIHGIPMTGENNRADFMQKVFDWFGMSQMNPSVDIDLNQSVFEAGDPLRLTLRLDNPGPNVTADVFIALDVLGTQFFFWPAWTEDVTWETRTLNSGHDTVETIFEFDWPTGAGVGDNCRFWAAMLNNQNAQLLGNLDFCPISWQ